MCGILYSIQDQTSQIDHPLIFGNEISEENGVSFYETDDSEKIKSLLIQPQLDNDLILTKSDQMKLDNLERLRTLNEKLISLNNTIKKKLDDDKLKQKLEIEHQIDQIVNHPIHDDELLNQDYNFWNDLISRIACRGPDYIQYQQFCHHDKNIQLFSSILSLRQPFNKQPTGTDDFILQFNGELYNEECLNTNDTDFIIHLLSKNLNACNTRKLAVLKTIAELNGEFAFVLTDKIESKVYFGKDYIGKRALLYSMVDSRLIISSLPPADHSRQNYIECKSSQLYQLDMTSFKLDTVEYESIWSEFGSDQRISFDPLAYNSSIANVSSKIENLYKVLNNACLKRQNTIHPLHETQGSQLGILFSGGLDCTVIAAMISDNIIQNGNRGYIDLMTIGFDNPRTNMKASESPDRKLSKKSWFNLLKKYNNELFKIRLVEINVEYREWLIHKKRVEKLIYPANTEMDLSIAIAFCLASRCSNDFKIELNDEFPKNLDFNEYMEDESIYSTFDSNYTSNAKVLFSGLGADELFAGYSRHESIFNDINIDASDSILLNKYQELSESLIYDIQVIYNRNLGRDDRAISSWGKELRYPYLDNKVINHVINDIEPNLKLKYEWQLKTTKKDKVGKQVKTYVRKWILRELAEFMGLSWVKDEMKRAIQFGAKSAKLEIGQSKTKGTDNL